MANKNETLLRTMDEAMSKDDIATMFSVFTDDVVYHIGGRSKMAGDGKGKEALQGTFGKFMQAMGPNATFETHDILANDTHGVVLQSFKAERSGERVTINGIGIFHFAGGKVDEVWFMDEDPYTADPFYDAGL